MNSNRFRITLQERSFDVEVLDDPNRSEVRVRVNGTVWPVKVEDLSPATVSEPARILEPEASATAPSAALEAPGGQKKAQQATLVKAPLPGVITAIYVQADQPVRCGQNLCSIETMKMNNVIQAPVDGVVGRVWVSQGQAVNFEEPLVEIRG